MRISLWKFFNRFNSRVLSFPIIML